MVRLGGGRQGGGTFGCLISLILFLAAVYYGVHIGGVYWRYYELRDEMRQQARFAGQFTDQAIQERLTATADSLLGQTPSFEVLRVARPSRITIRTEYTERVQLPFFIHDFLLRPQVEEPL